MNYANKLEHRTMERDIITYTLPILHPTTQVTVEPDVQIAMGQRRNLTFIVGEADGEHTVRGRVIGYRAESGGSLQIRNEWGRFLIPISNIVRVF